MAKKQASSNNGKNEQIVITPENIGNVVFKDVVLKYDLTTSFDETARKAEQTRKVKIEIDLTDADANEVLEKAAGKYAIKANSPGGPLKGNPAVFDAETYLSFLSDNDNKFKFRATALGAKTRRGANPLQSGINATQRMNTEQLEALLEHAKRQLEAKKQNA